MRIAAVVPCLPNATIDMLVPLIPLRISQQNRPRRSPNVQHRRPSHGTHPVRHILAFPQEQVVRGLGRSTHTEPQLVQRARPQRAWDHAPQSRQHVRDDDDQVIRALRGQLRRLVAPAPR